MAHRILLIGASGTGTTSTAAALAQSTGFYHCDLDSLLWESTDPPFQKRKSHDNLKKLAKREIYCHENWVISGDPSSWKINIEDWLTLAIFLIVPTDIRLERISARERKRFGDAVAPGGHMYEMHQQFLEWTRQYDIGGIQGRTRKGQEAWLNTLKCPVLKIEGNFMVEEVVSQIEVILQT